MSKGTDASDVNLKREVLSGTTAKIGLQVVAFVGTILFARLLGPSDFGGYYLLLSLVTVASLPAVGWSTAARKRFSEDVSVHQRAEIVGSQLLFAAFAIGVCVIAVTVFDGPLRRYTGVHQAPALLFVLLSIIIVYEVYRSLVKARGLVGVVFWADFIRELCGTALQLGLVFIGLSVVGMVAGYGIATVLALPVVIYYTGIRPTLPSRDTIDSLWRYARFSVPNAVLGTAYHRFDVLLLGFILAPTAVSYYEVAYRLSMPAILIAQVSGAAIMSRVSNLESKNQSTQTDISNTLAFSSLLAPPLFFGALGTADDLIVAIYGSEFAAAAPLLVGLTLYRVIQSQSVVYMNIIAGWDRPDIYMRIAAITLVINICLGVILTLEYGAIGVVIATVAAEFGQYTLMILTASRHLPPSVLFPREFMYQAVSGIVMLGTITLVKSPLATHRPAPLAIVLTVGAATYFGVLLILSTRFRSSTTSTFQKLYHLTDN